MLEKLKQGPRLRGTVLLAAVISCYAAFINGYPLVHQDTGTYIHSGYAGTVPFDRPIVYGLFLHLFSTSFTLFPVIFVQALLVCYLLDLTVGMRFRGALRSAVTLFLVTTLTLFSSYSYIVCTLVPDVFTPIVFMGVLNVLLNRDLGRLQLTLVSSILVLALCTQFSSLYVTAICLVMLLAAVAFLRMRRRALPVAGSRLVIATALVASPFLVIPLVNFSYSGQFRVESAGPVFFVNHANETGVLKVFLEEDCPRGAPYKLCAFRDSLVWDFIWQSHSPFYKLGGWEGNHDEYRRMMWEMLTRRKFLFPLIQRGIEGTFRQLFFFDVPLVVPQRIGSAPFEQIRWRYAPTLRDYQNSAHYNARLNVRPVNEIQRVLLLFSFLVIFIVFAADAFWRRVSPQLRLSIIFFIIYMVVQAGFSANLSTIDSRYQSRVTWLIPVIALMCFPVFLKSEDGR